jgi:hypothetical protein
MSRKRNKTSLVRAVCRNCGTPTVGRYCHTCGQDITAGTNRRITELVGNSLGTIFAWDSKVFRTLWYLVAYPGRLTTEFYAGRIVRYVFPSKLFWFIAVIFFAILLGTSNLDTATDTDPRAEAIKEQVTAELAPLTSLQAPTDANEETSVDEEKNFFENVLTSPVGRERFIGWFTSALPYVTLLLVPLFALLVQMFFRRRERAYSDYLVFSLHLNSFVFLLLAVWLAVSWIFPEVGGNEWFFLWIPTIYLGLALWRVFRPRIVPMILKIGLLGIIYLIIMALMTVLFVIVLAVFINKFYTFA